MLKLKLCILMVIALPMAAQNATDYSSIATKAERFYKYKEWASASAMYSLMLDERPAATDVYGKAIAVAGMQEEPRSQVSLLHQALRHGVEIDSLFTAVRRSAFELGEAPIYERFLYQTKQSEPWLTRTVDSYLLRYYSYRNDPDKLIEYSKIMLEGLPESEPFLYDLARGYLLKGDYDNALATYHRILALNPQAYDAMLYLGNYYSTKTDDVSRSLAISLLRGAYELHPTPYVARLLSSLR